MSTTAPVAVQPVPRALGKLVGRRVRDWAPALLVLVLGLVGWQQAIRIFAIEDFLLPRPTVIATTFWEGRDELLRAGWFTFQEALGGFAIGCGAAVALALLLARWRGLGRALMPYAIAANAIPIIAFAPITNAWFSPLTKSSKIAIAAVLCFFPVLVNALRGLTSVRPASIDLMRSYGAGELAIFRQVRLPTALPYIFTGMKVASVLAMIGAVVGEYFGGSFEALGVLIRSRAQIFAFAEAWAAIVVASGFGIAFYLAIALIERVTLHWLPAARE
ncbi:MAG: ABC transporter permease [Actinobacteria bacterium]|nr:ABC transporter permease [Actinomycetota bacterium]